MIKTETGLLKALKAGAIVSRRWGGFRIVSPDGAKSSVLPKLIPNLAEAGRIKRVDDKTTCFEEWGIA